MPSRNALDCSRLLPALFWGLTGVALAVLAFMAQGMPNAASALRVGADNPLRAQIERDLGPITLNGRTGHDGQLYYLIARDPFATGSTVDALIAFDTPRYRYRRILVPLLAGGFGQFSPRVTLFGMILCAVLGMALTAIAIADLVFTLDVAGGAAPAGILNLGAIASVMLLTVDVMAMGLALSGIALLVRGHAVWALIALALATLTKETYLLAAFGLAAWQWREGHSRIAVWLLIVPSLPFAFWSAWLWYVIPGIPEPALLGRPMVGVVSSVRDWLSPSRLPGIQGPFAAYALFSFVVTALMVWLGRRPVLKWSVAPWLVLACFTGSGVWGIPSNIGRAFSILWPLGLLMLFARRQGYEARRATTINEVPNGSQRASAYSARNQA